MTESMEQMDLRVRCLPDGQKTLAPKEYRVRWLSRLQLPLIGFAKGFGIVTVSRSGGHRAKRAWTQDGKDDRVPANIIENPNPVRLVEQSNTWPHPVTNGKNTRLHHGLLNWNTTGSAEPELLRSFWSFCIWFFGWCPPMPESLKAPSNKVSLRPGVHISSPIEDE